MKADEALGRLGLASSESRPAASDGRFPDGAHFRIEIPSVENLRVLEAVLEEARRHEIVVNRVSQGSGAMLLGESELRETAAVAAEAGVEVSLFVGPREGYGLGAHARSEDGVGHAGQVRGVRGLSYAIEDVARAVEAGIRSFLVADTGLLMLLRDMQSAGELPAECGWKISVAMAPSNPAALVVLGRARGDDGQHPVRRDDGRARRDAGGDVASDRSLHRVAGQPRRRRPRERARRPRRDRRAAVREVRPAELPAALSRRRASLRRGDRDRAR